jgi:hypothetical protein
MRTVKFAAAAALLLSAVTTGVVHAESDRSGAACAQSEQVMAHQAGQTITAAPNLPTSCGVMTGYRGGENQISVAKAGVIYAPAVLIPGPAGLGYAQQLPGPRAQTTVSPSGLAITNDAGATWALSLPMGMEWQSTDHAQFVDRTTGRFFYYNLNANPVPQSGISPQEQAPGSQAQLFWTDDAKIWTHTTGCCPAFSENPRFMAAPPTARGPVPQNYPNVLYFCANTTIDLDLLPAGARVCSRSFDGGTTWNEASILFSKPVPQHSECGTNGESYGAGDGRYPQAAPDGSLYVMVACGSKLFLARSTDEALSWPIIKGPNGPLTIPAADELRVDNAGNLYLFRLTNNQLRMRTSTDGGQSWTDELNLTAPGVTSVGTWTVAVRAPGQVALGYYGQQKGQPTFDGYITETADALASQPTFYSAIVNDPKAPLLASSTTAAPGPGYLDYNGVDIAPDGTAWASFVGDCNADNSPTAAIAPVCTADSQTTYYGAYGFAGWLSPPPA